MFVLVCINILYNMGDFMSRRLNAFIAIAFILFMAAAVVATFLSCEKKDDVSATNPTQASEEGTEYKTYVVKEYDGVVAVFEPGSEKPLKVTERYVSALPQPDRDKLSAGIKVSSREELRKLLEDLCS